MSKNGFHLAQINTARALASLDDPLMEGFVSQLAEVNALADESPGFVWRLADESGNAATDIHAFDDERILVNMSVWESLEALRAVQLSRPPRVLAPRPGEMVRAREHAAHVVVDRGRLGPERRGREAQAGASRGERTDPGGVHVQGPLPTAPLAVTAISSAHDTASHHQRGFAHARAAGSLGQSDRLQVWGRHAPGRRGVPGEQRTVFFTGKQYARFEEQQEKAARAGTPDAGHDPAARVTFQKKTGIEAEVLYPTLGLSILHSSNRADYRDVVRAASRVYNDWLAEFIAHDRKRLIGSAMIPMDDVGWAVEELERVAKKGFRTPMIHAAPPEGCPPYRDKIYDPFWARAEEMELPITLHIVTGRIPDPMACHTVREWEEGP